MTNPGPVDLVRLRKRPTQAQLHLAIYQPSNVLTAQINDVSIEKGAQSIVYDNAAGNWQEIESGMTMYVGTTPGAKDVGRIRVRTATPAAISVAENDHIDWQDDLYLTIVSFFEPWGIFTRIVLDANNIPIFYKDYDIEYDGQNQLFDPVLHMGPNYAGFIETGAFGMRFSSSGSFDPTDGSSPTGFSWIFEDGTPTGSNEPHPGLVQWTDPGCYTVHLTATTDKGKSSHSHRHVTVMRRPEQGGSPCGLVTEWGLNSMRGSRREHGWSVGLWVRETADIDKITEGALVLIISDARYGDDENLGPDKAIGGQAYARSNLVFAGYIEDESIEYDYETSKLEFKAASIMQILESKHSFSVSLESQTNAMTWYQIRDMTVDKAVLHYLKWQSTALDIADFHPTGDGRGVQFMDFGRGPIADSVYDLYESTLFADVAVDRQGSIWSEIDPRMVQTGSRSHSFNMKLSKEDYIQIVDITRMAINPLAYVELGGIAYSGPVTGTNAPYLSGAPGDAPGYEGSVNAISGLVLSSQDELNELSGLYYARDNARYPEIVLQMAGPYTNIDIAPYEFVTMDLAAEETWRRVTWYDKRFLPTDITIEYDPMGSLTMQVTLAEETWGKPGETIIIPVEPPYDEPDLPDWDIEFPPLVPLPGLFPEVIPPVGIGDYVIGLFNGIFVKTSDFWSSASPTWQTVTVPGSITGSAATGNLMFWNSYIDPANLVYVGAPASYGFRGQVLNGFFDAPVAGVNDWWNETDCDLYLGANPTQRRVGHTQDIPELGYIVAFCGQALLGATAVWARGRVSAAWAATDVGYGGYPNPANQTDGFTWCGGTVFVAHDQASRIIRSVNGGVSWSSVAVVGVNNRTFYYDDQPNWVFMHGIQTTQPGINHFLFHPNACYGVSSYDDMLDISLYYGGSTYTPYWPSNVGNGSISKALQIAPNGSILGLLERQSGGGPAYILAKKADPYSAWQIYDTSPATFYALDYYKPDPQKLVCYRNSEAKVYGTQDAGLTWVDKTGNLKSIVPGSWGSVTCRGLKYVWTR